MKITAGVSATYKLSFFTRRVLRKRLSSPFFTIPFESLKRGSYDAILDIRDASRFRRKRFALAEKKRKKHDFLIQRNDKQAVFIGTNIYFLATKNYV